MPSSHPPNARELILVYVGCDVTSVDVLAAVRFVACVRARPCGKAAFGLPIDAGPGGAGGACTNALLTFVSDEHADDTWVSLLVRMQTYLKAKGYHQIPQLSVGNASLGLRGKFSVLNPRRKWDTPKVSRNTRAVLIGRVEAGARTSFLPSAFDFPKTQKARINVSHDL